MRLVGILDTETTSLDPKVGHLLEIGVIRYSVPLGRIVDQWSLLVDGATENPAEKTNGIPIAMTKEYGHHIATATTALAHHLMPCDAILAHNARFDKAWCDHHLGSLPAKPWFCTKDDFDWFHGKAGDSLISLAVAHGVPVIAAHRALTDCGLIAGILSTYPPADVVNLLLGAARPRILLQSKHKFQDNDAAKAMGFRWDGGSKRWLRRHIKSDPVPTDAWPIVEVPE